MSKEFDLSVTDYGTVKRLAGDYKLAILPWGATEPHNYHLPYLTDALLSHAIGVDTAKAVYRKYGMHTMTLPPIALGSQNPGQRELPFCLHVRYSTQTAILRDIVDSLLRQGIDKMLIINGHGGNTFKGMIRDMSARHPEMMIAVTDWFRAVDPKDYFDFPGDHADEIETSVMMHYRPELVDLSRAGSGEALQFKSSLIQEGRAWLPRNWQIVSRDTGIGYPGASTAEKGARFARAVSEALADFCHDLIVEDLYTDGKRK